MRLDISDVLEVLGAVLVIVAAALWDYRAALGVAGLALVASGWYLGAPAVDE